MKSIIMDHTEQGVYVLTRSGDFKFVVGHTHLAVGEEIELHISKKPIARRFSAIAAGIALFLVLGVAALWHTEAYAVFVDINPSFQVSFNVFDRVKSVRPLNSDGEEFVQQLELSGGYQSVLSTLLTAAEEYGRETGLSELGTPYIQLTVAARQEENLALYYTRIDEFLSSNHFEGVVLEVCNQNQIDAADSYGISPGKLKMSAQVREYMPDYSVDVINQMSTAEVHLALREAKMASEAAMLAEAGFKSALAAASLAEAAAKTAQEAYALAEALAFSGTAADIQKLASPLAQSQEAAYASRDASKNAETAAAGARAQATKAAQAASAAAQTGIRDAESFASQAELAARQAAYYADVAARCAESVQAVYGAAQSAKYAKNDTVSNGNIVSNGDKGQNENVDSTVNNGNVGTDASENSQPNDISDNGDSSVTDDKLSLDGNSADDSVDSSSEINGTAVPDDGNSAYENSNDLKSNPNANENSSSNNGSPPGENSGNGNKNPNANENSSSNNGSPPGENSGNGNKNNNANENSSSNNGSPPGENSGNGNKNKSSGSEDTEGEDFDTGGDS